MRIGAREGAIAPYIRAQATLKPEFGAEGVDETATARHECMAIKRNFSRAR
jgi:hypothetical protein